MSLIKRLTDNDVTLTSFTYGHEKIYGLKTPNELMVNIKQICNALKTNTSLKELKFIGNYIPYNLLEDIIDSIASNENNNITKITFKRTFREIEKKITDEQQVKLSNLISKLFYSEQTNSEGKLYNPFKLTELCLSSNGITDIMLEQSFIPLKNNNSLITLDLSSNLIKTEGIKLISDALETNTTLTELNLSYNKIYSEGLIILSNLLKVNHILLNLNLAGSGVAFNKGSKRDFTGLFELVNSLKINKTLKELDLSNNEIGTNGFKHSSILKELFTNLFTVSSSLTSLNLSKNHIGHDIIFPQITNALTSNTVLKSLDLSENFLYVDDNKNISNALMKNTTLTRLILLNNPINVEILQYLSNIFDTNTTLTDLKLGLLDRQLPSEITDSPLFNQLMDKINKQLQRNKSMITQQTGGNISLKQYYNKFYNKYYT